MLCGGGGGAPWNWDTLGDHTIWGGGGGPKLRTRSYMSKGGVPREGLQAELVFIFVAAVRQIELRFGLEPWNVLIGAAGEQAKMRMSDAVKNGLPWDNIAQVAVHWAVKRLDTQGSCVEVAVYPRRLKQVTADVTMTLSGQILQCLTEASGAELPPLGICFDGALYQRCLNRATLAVAHRDELAKYEFWDRCWPRQRPNKGTLECYVSWCEISYLSS